MLRLSPTPTYTPESDSDDDDDEEPPQHHVRPLFPTPPHDDELPHDAAQEAAPHDVALAADEADDQGHLQPRPTLRLSQPTYGQKKYLKVGDVVALVQGDAWCKVVLSSHSGHRDVKDQSLYWNYAALDGSNTTGSYLFPGDSWGVLRDDDAQVDLSQVDIELPGHCDVEPVVNPIETNEDIDDDPFDIFS
jgi:hypothetical protein